MSAGRETLVPFLEARRLLLEAAVLGPVVEVDLGRALGLVLAEDVAADRDAPPADRAAMDGYAVRAGDVVAPGAALRVVGEVRAGEPAHLTVGPGEAVRIFTGAVRPEGSDAVVMVELADEDRAARTVVLRERPVPGQHIRRRAEDVRAGERVVRSGTPIGAATIAVLASFGRARVRVRRPPGVAIAATGDEIVAIDAEPLAHQERNSNAAGLAAQLGAMGLSAHDLGVARDDPESLDRAVAAGLAHDAFLITGGVSAGAYDLVVPALRRAGVELLFHGVAMRPGKPVAAGRRGGCLVVGLPGNPLSTFTAFEVLVAPALRRMAGHDAPLPAEWSVPLGARLARRPGRTTFHLARLDRVDGRPVVRPVATAGSGDVAALARANAFIVAPGSPAALEPGDSVTVIPWPAALGSLTGSAERFPV